MSHSTHYKAISEMIFPPNCSTGAETVTTLVLAKKIKQQNYNTNILKNT